MQINNIRNNTSFGATIVKTAALKNSYEHVIQHGNLKQVKALSDYTRAILNDGTNRKFEFDAVQRTSDIPEVYVPNIVVDGKNINNETKMYYKGQSFFTSFEKETRWEMPLFAMNEVVSHDKNIRTAYNKLSDTVAYNPETVKKELNKISELDYRDPAIIDKIKIFANELELKIAKANLKKIYEYVFQ